MSSRQALTKDVDELRAEERGRGFGQVRGRRLKGLECCTRGGSVSL
jgi:hypothetical protein